MRVSSVGNNIVRLNDTYVVPATGYIEIPDSIYYTDYDLRSEVKEMARNGILTIAKEPAATAGKSVFYGQIVLDPPNVGHRITNDSVHSITLRADWQNVDRVWIGASGMTNVAPNFGGVYLTSGESISITVNDMSELYAMAINGGDRLFWLGVG